MFSDANKCCIVSINNDTEEIKELCRTLSVQVETVITQKRNRPDPQTFIGKGKLQELKEIVNTVDLFVVNGNLRPSQHFRLETFLKKPCIDRIAMILEIFERHSGSTEAKAQSSLAKIRYELPFLREWANKALHDDRPGFLAGGEYAVDAYYEYARKRMKSIEAELERISAQRENRRKRRKQLGFYLISICGYTNGGKSSLLNALSASEIQVDDMMFSTLSTTTRRISESGKKILLTDTVGFIRNLPPNLIDAFDATLEEIFGSDCTILVLDFSNSIEMISEKLSTSLRILIPRINHSNIIIALNKIDGLTQDEIQQRINSLERDLVEFSYFFISAKCGLGIKELIKGIFDKLGLIFNVRITLPNDENGKELYQWLSNRFTIIDAKWEDDIDVELEISEEGLELLKSKAENRGITRI